jgi:hypothetical protein
MRFIGGSLPDIHESDSPLQPAAASADPLYTTILTEEPPPADSHNVTPRRPARSSKNPFRPVVSDPQYSDQWASNIGPAVALLEQNLQNEATRSQLFASEGARAQQIVELLQLVCRGADSDSLGSS